MHNEFKFSIIMSLCHMDLFWEEALESIFQQTIGFKENIQLILVDNSESDEIETVSLEYRETYPQNIVYIRSGEQGLPDSRSEGMEHIRGEYVNFFSSNDKWKLDAFEKGYDFLETHKETDAVFCRQCFLGESAADQHSMDDRVSEQKVVVDITEQHTHIQLDLNPVFIRAQALDGINHSIWKNMKEDWAFITRIILQKGNYGILPGAIYYSRRKDSKHLERDLGNDNSACYHDALRYCHMELFQESKEKYGKVLPYIQNLIMYDIQWRLQELMPETFPQESLAMYKQTLAALLKEIEDKIIWEQKMHYSYKLYALELKHGEKVLEKAELKKGRLIYHDLKLINIRAPKRFRINILAIEKDYLILEGMSSLNCLGDRGVLYVRSNQEKRYPIALYQVGHGDKIAFTGETLLYNMGFHVEIPLHFGENFEFWIEVDQVKIRLAPAFGKFAKLNQSLAHTYYVQGKYLLKYENNKLKCMKNRVRTHVASELRYMRDLMHCKKKTLLLYRCGYHFLKAMKKRPAWAIYDRFFVAGDNAEALFQYLSRINAGRSINFWFSIYKDVPDFNRLKQIGRVIPYDTMRYRMNFLLADKIISSHIDEGFANAFAKDEQYMRDLYKFDYVFLQHGVIQNNLSSWLYKQKKNIRLFVTSAQREKESIVDGKYGYAEKEIKLLGLPRHDHLYSERQKKIIFLPTWRKSIVGRLGARKGLNDYSNEFKETEYFRFYNNLINDPEILQAMEEEHFTGEFYVHPSFKAQFKDFQGNGGIIVGESTANYKEVFKTADLLITDYSSVAFDFARLKKPIIYSQFDKETFYKAHIMTNKGYFSYEKDGFGPVCYDYDSTVKEIVRQLRNGCYMGEIYQNRVSDFFAYMDHNNCERVYKAILEIDKE